MKHRLGLVAWLAAFSTVGCAPAAMVVRGPQVREPHASSVLAEVASLAIAVPPAKGSAVAADPLGERAGGWGRPGGDIELTERPGDLLRRVVVQELEEAGHRVTETGADVVLQVSVLAFDVEAPRSGRGWDVVVAIQAALRVEGKPASEDWSEFVLTSERTGHTLAPPSLALVERILAEAVHDFGRLVAERDALAAALERHGRDAG